MKVSSDMLKTWDSLANGDIDWLDMKLEHINGIVPVLLACADGETTLRDAVKNFNSEDGLKNLNEKSWQQTIDECLEKQNGITRNKNNEYVPQPGAALQQLPGLIALCSDIYESHYEGSIRTLILNDIYNAMRSLRDKYLNLSCSSYYNSMSTLPQCDRPFYDTDLAGWNWREDIVRGLDNTLLYYFIFAAELDKAENFDAQKEDIHDDARAEIEKIVNKYKNYE